MNGNSPYIGIGYFVLGLCALIASAQINVHFPGLAVPFTLQTAVLLFVSIALGLKSGLAIVLVYILLGIIGIPVFASAPNSPAMFQSGSAGYLLGFIPAVFLITRFTKLKLGLIIIFILAHLVILVIGMVGLMLNKGLSIEIAFTKGVWPFIPGAIVKSILVYVIWYLTNRFIKTKSHSGDI